MIEYIAYIALGAGLLRLLTAFLNFMFMERLRKEKDEKKLPELSVLIPVRNEEANIGNILSDLIKTKSRCLKEILVFDDLSEDNTADIVNEYSLKDKRIRLIRSKGLPDGWLGKNHACHTLAGEAKGEYFLFLDADVRIKPEFAGRVLDYIVRKKVSLLSIFPTQRMYTYAERISVPNMHIILLSLLLLPMVRISGFSSVSAANGQCMLFDSKTYKNLSPHYKFKASRAEDIEIARYFKARKYKVSCMTGSRLIQCRMYESLSGAVEGFSKNVIFFFGNSYIASVFYWAFTTLGWIPVLIISFRLFLFYILMEIIIRIFISLTAKQNVLNNIILAIPQQFILGAFIIKSWKNKHKSGFSWKGRKI